MPFLVDLSASYSTVCSGSLLSSTLISVVILHLNSLFSHSPNRNSFINDTRIIEFLFEVSRTLHDAVNFSNSKESEYATAKLICHFIRKVISVAFNYSLARSWNSNTGGL